MARAPKPQPQDETQPEADTTPTTETVWSPATSTTEVKEINGVMVETY